MPYYREKAKCPKCNGKMIIYYGDYCPMCFSKAKTKKNYIRSHNFIEHKYDLNIDDYAAKSHGQLTSTSFNCDHEEKWKEKLAPIPTKYLTDPLPNCRFNQKGMDWYDTPAGRDFFRKRDEAYYAAHDGKAQEIPYQNWHHLFCDVYQFHNDSWIKVNWQNVYDSCEHDWQRDITRLFIKEFGKKDILMEFSW
jgi:hypothetical protein